MFHSLITFNAFQANFNAEIHRIYGIHKIIHEIRKIQRIGVKQKKNLNNKKQFVGA